MAVILSSGPPWRGGCVLRIRKATAALVEAAERNLVVGDRPDCDARKYGFPRALMAKDFRAKAHELDLELLRSIDTFKLYPKAAEYPADNTLAIEVKGALEWLANVFGQLLDFWGWVEPEFEEQHYTEHLVYKISEADLGNLKHCLRRLDEAIERHPAQKTTASEPKTGVVASDWTKESKSPSGPRQEPPKQTWEPGFHEPDGDESEPHRKVQLKDGRTAIFHPRFTTRWVSEPSWDLYSEFMTAQLICMTKSNKWIRGESSYEPVDGVAAFDDRSDSSFWEVSESEAQKWFLDNWNIHDGTVPSHFLEAIKKLDIDEIEDLPPSPYTRRVPSPPPLPPQLAPVQKAPVQPPPQPSQPGKPPGQLVNWLPYPTDAPILPDSAHPMTPVPGVEVVGPANPPKEEPKEEPKPDGWREAYRDLIRAKRKSKASAQVALLEFMIDRAEAEVEAIAQQVHDDSEASEDTIRQNVKRVNDSLTERCIPIRFSVRSGYVFKDVSPG